LGGGQGGKLEIKPERRPASYEVIDARNNTKRVEVLDLVNTIRGRWMPGARQAGPASPSSRASCLEHWHDREGIGSYPFYFCQLEAIETLIWWVEGAEEFKQGIAIPGRWRPVGAAVQQDGDRVGQDHGDGDDHHLAGAERADLSEAEQGFRRAVFIVAPGLTVKERLQVLMPSEGSYYDEFNLCPSEAMRQKLNQAEVRIENWHTLMPAAEPKRSVVKKGRSRTRPLPAACWASWRRTRTSWSSTTRRTTPIASPPR
jgi:type III restriction enzyme